MNTPAQPPGVAGRWTTLLLSAVIGLAVVGYCVGLRDGVPREDDTMAAMTLVPEGSPHLQALDVSTASIPALSYANMRRGETGPTSRWKPGLDQLPQPPFDLFAEIKPSEQDKLQSTRTRASRRAFNGAPPVIPHAVEKTTDAACYACHGSGIHIGNQVANPMSHRFLANCTQCHAPPPPKPFSNFITTVDTTFVGLPAPLQGHRAFPGAPPTIPHSTWMREKCLACHGNEAGWAGLQSTHPWRLSCTQCHAPSATLEQAIAGEVDLLAAPDVQAQ